MLQQLVDIEIADVFSLVSRFGPADPLTSHLILGWCRQIQSFVQILWDKYRSAFQQIGQGQLMHIRWELSGGRFQRNCIVYCVVWYLHDVVVELLVTVVLNLDRIDQLGKEMPCHLGLCLHGSLIGGAYVLHLVKI